MERVKLLCYDGKELDYSFYILAGKAIINATNYNCKHTCCILDATNLVSDIPLILYNTTSKHFEIILINNKFNELRIKSIYSDYAFPNGLSNIENAKKFIIANKIKEVN